MYSAEYKMYQGICIHTWWLLLFRNLPYYPTLQYPAEQIVYMIEKLFSLERGGSKVYKSFL
jgi:hypothetical protein